MIDKDPNPSAESNEDESQLQETGQKANIPRIYPDVPLEILQTCDLHDDFSYDIATASPEQREIIFARVIAEADEQWASEALAIDQPFSPAEQEQLVAIISDPYKSVEILSLDEERTKKLTTAQKEKFMTQIESDLDVVQYFYDYIVAGGIAEDPDITDNQKWWIERLEKALGM